MALLGGLLRRGDRRRWVTAAMAALGVFGEQYNPMRTLVGTGGASNQLGGWVSKPVRAPQRSASREED